jgi:hypothetical protein
VDGDVLAAPVAGAVGVVGEAGVAGAAAAVSDVLAMGAPFLLLAPLYKSPYQPLPFKMKFPWVICREASALPQLGQSLIASSEILCTRSN